MTVVKVLTICLVLLVTGAKLPGSETGPWHTDLEAALAAAEDKPLALLFIGVHCPPCHQMLQESSADAGVVRALQEVVGVSLDLDDHRLLAMRLGITATPTLVLINRKRELVRTSPGYMPVTDLATSLRVLSLHGDDKGRGPVQLQRPDLEAILASDDPGQRLKELLGVGDTESRLAARQAMSQISDAGTLLWPLLTDPALGVRVDAAAVLAQLYDFANDYDPFAEAADRHHAAEAWRRRVTDELERLP